MSYMDFAMPPCPSRRMSRYSPSSSGGAIGSTAPHRFRCRSNDNPYSFALVWKVRTGMEIKSAARL
jgi:hypothetical protein